MSNDQLEPGSIPLSADTLKSLKACSTATLTTQLFKRGFQNLFIQGAIGKPPVRTIWSGRQRHCAISRHVKTLIIWASSRIDRIPSAGVVEDIPQGHVLVMDTRGDTRAASAGHIPS